MKLTVTLDYGAIDAEFVGDDREEIENNLLQFHAFLQENDDELRGLQWQEEDSSGRGSRGELSQSAEGSSEEEEEEKHPLASLARRVGVSIETLDDIIWVDPEGEELPQVLVDKQTLGGNKTERQRKAAYMILRVWEDCYGEDRMKTSELKSILTMGDISDVDLFNAWAGPGKGDFDPTGSGASATVGLKGPGKREALKVFKDIAEKVQSD